MEIIRLSVAPIGENCYIVSEGKEAFIVDPGGEADKIINAAKNFDVKCILLTHAHFDHIMALNKVKQAFPEAELAVNALEKEWLYSAKLNMSEDFWVGFDFVYEGRIDIEPEDGSQLDFAGTKIDILHTPGHTPGSMCFYIEKPQNDGKHLLFSGDTLFKNSVGRTDFPYGDGKKIIESIKNRLMTLPDDTVVYPGHDESTTIAVEKKFNPFLKRDGVSL